MLRPQAQPSTRPGYRTIETKLLFAPQEPSDTRQIIPKDGPVFTRIQLATSTCVPFRKSLNTPSSYCFSSHSQRRIETASFDTAIHPCSRNCDPAPRAFLGRS